jgi:TolB-like protein/Tfp pilus assembly protein PilF
MSDVFVSYKAEDRPRVEPLVEALEAEGLSVWWDARVGGGEAWREAIAEHLDSAGCVIVVWSKRSTGPEGRFVRDEASRAQRRQTYLPVTIDKVDPPLGFGEMQALSLIGWKGDSSDPHYRAVSACVHSMLGRKSPAEVERDRPARLTRRTAIVAGGSAALVAAGTGGWLLLRPSGARANTIAVLPFANLSGDRSQDYFSDGLAEEVRAALAALGSLHVVARTSSEMLRNTDAVTAARRLNVANVVTGSVRRSPSTVRVSAQLIDGEDGLEQWSQSFDRPLGDVLEIQSDIAANVARALSFELGSSGPRAASLGGTRNPEAQDIMLRATVNDGDDSSAGMLRRIALFERATQLDPNYAEAFARKGLQQTLWANAWAGSNVEKDRVNKAAFKAIKRAIVIAPEMPLGHSALGISYQTQLSMQRALQALHQSVQLPGADGLAFFNYGFVLGQAKRQAEAQSAVERGLSIDPLNFVGRQVQASIFYYGRRYADAIDAARNTLAIAPQNNRARVLMVWSLIQLNRMDEAVRELQKAPPTDYRRLVTEGIIAARSGRKEDALRAIDRLRTEFGDTVNYQFAQVYSQLGMIDEAAAALQVAWETRDTGLAAMQVDTFMDPMRNDRRYLAIRKQVFG